MMIRKNCPRSWFAGGAVLVPYLLCVFFSYLYPFFYRFPLFRLSSPIAPHQCVVHHPFDFHSTEFPSTHPLTCRLRANPETYTDTRSMVILGIYQVPHLQLRSIIILYNIMNIIRPRAARRPRERFCCCRVREPYIRLCHSIIN